MSKRHFDNEPEKNELFDDKYNTFLSYKIVNIVGTVVSEIDKEIDLIQISLKYPDVEYNPDRFPGLVMRVDKPSATVLIFTTGRMVVAGLKKTSDAKKIVQKVSKRIQKAGFKLMNPKITIQNIVATSDLKYNIDLNLATLVAENVMYEPEVFPGLIYKMQDPKACFLIFSTGKVVCLGAKKIETIKTAILKLNDQVHKYGVIMEDLESNEFDNLSFL